MMRIVIGIASLGFLAFILIFTLSVLSPVEAEPTPEASITALPFCADPTSTPTATASMC